MLVPETHTIRWNGLSPEACCKDTPKLRTSTTTL